MQLGYVVAIALGVVALAVIAVLWRRFGLERAALEAARDARSGLERQLAIEQQRSGRLTELQQELAESRGDAKALRDGKGAVEQQLAAAEGALGEKTRFLDELRAKLAAFETALTEKTEEIARLLAQLAGRDEALAQERRQAAEKLRIVEQARDQMTREFKLLSEEIAARHSETFAKQNKEQVEAVLTPLREKILEFQNGLQSAHTETAKDREGLRQHIQQLAEVSARMMGETHSLAEALRGSAKTQGAWGEMILGSILERSGLREGQEYVTQQSHATEEGKWLRPDVIVHLPRDGNLVIDSKVSLAAFEEYVVAATDEQRKSALDRHLQSLRAHIRALSAKDYQGVTKGGLDYVVMFVPIEGALAAALQADPELTALAAGCNVAIATPTTLMIALRTVRNVWQMERRNQNAEQIADRAGKLYDKFVGFVSDMKSLGERLGKARECYDSAWGKLYQGGGNLVRQTEQLKGLGAKTSKALPAELLSLSHDVAAE